MGRVPINTRMAALVQAIASFIFILTVVRYITIVVSNAVIADIMVLIGASLEFALVINHVRSRAIHALIQTLNIQIVFILLLVGYLPGIR